MKHVKQNLLCVHLMRCSLICFIFKLSYVGRFDWAKKWLNLQICSLWLIGTLLVFNKKIRLLFTIIFKKANRLWNLGISETVNWQIYLCNAYLFVFFVFLWSFDFCNDNHNVKLRQSENFLLWWSVLFYFYELINCSNEKKSRFIHYSELKSQKRKEILKQGKK